ncbi:MAG: glutathione S-transferase [Hyphomicrobium sp.]|nr:glutathione S-transferase [Hyphomicrobium sp.]
MRIIETRRAPNPRRVRVFLAEKSVPVEFEERDMMEGALAAADIRAMNPWMRVPILVLDDGRTVSESVAICRYFEELYPTPALFGSDAYSRATIEMWNRRIEFGLFQHVAQVVRHSSAKMAAFEQPQIGEWAEANRHKVVPELTRIDAQLATAPFIAGEIFSIADITALVAIDFMKPAKLAVPETLTNIVRWHHAVSQRPSARA